MWCARFPLTQHACPNPCYPYSGAGVEAHGSLACVVLRGGEHPSHDRKAATPPEVIDGLVEERVWPVLSPPESGPVWPQRRILFAEVLFKLSLGYERSASKWVKVFNIDSLSHQHMERGLNFPMYFDSYNVSNRRLVLHAGQDRLCS